MKVRATVTFGLLPKPQQSCRAGGGIYRHTWLTTAPPLHVVPHGVFASAAVLGSVLPMTDEGAAGEGALTSEGGAIVTAETTLLNSLAANASATVTSVVIGPQGESTAPVSVSAIIPAGDDLVVSQLINVSAPCLWSIESPSLYTLLTTVQQTGSADAAALSPTDTDTVNTTFGIRRLRFDSNQGLFLNDQHVTVKGLCNHQDFGGCGVAVPDRINEYRVAALKEMGGNAWRCSHNPPNPELLDATDRQGMLVWDEVHKTACMHTAFLAELCLHTDGDGSALQNRVYGPHDNYDRSAHPAGKAAGYEPHPISEVIEDVKALILRDRNHPSVIWWSLCNEQGCQNSPDSSQPFAAEFAAQVKEQIELLDSTRVNPTACKHSFSLGCVPHNRWRCVLARHSRADQRLRTGHRRCFGRAGNQLQLQDPGRLSPEPSADPDH